MKTWAPPPPSRCLKMVLTDGFTTVDALEFEPCPSELPEPVATGTKITLRFKHFEQIQSMLSVSKKSWPPMGVLESITGSVQPSFEPRPCLYVNTTGLFHVTPIE